jgi:hypothetical protein
LARSASGGAPGWESGGSENLFASAIEWLNIIMTPQKWIEWWNGGEHPKFLVERYGFQP